MAKFFDWTTLLLRNAFSNDDGKDQRSDRHRHRRDDGKGDPAKRDDDDVFKYQTTGGREQSDVREESRRRREKDEGEKKQDAAGVKKSTRHHHHHSFTSRFDGKGCDEDLSSSEAFERRIKRECEKILKRLKSSFNTSS